MIPYLLNPRMGGVSYKIVHSYVLPLSLAIIAGVRGEYQLLPYVVIWFAHIGFDRALAFGLKYPSAFGKTHLS